MATRKDLVEANAFSHRRLVTAFVSGSPGGREVEPPQPGRAVLGGLGLSVLLLAGAAVLGILAPRTDPDWLREDNLVASETGGSLYLVHHVGGTVELRPFTNAMSARLLLGDQDTVTATADDIAGQDVGPQIGIYDPPPQVAVPSRLVQSGWTACTTAGQGISLDITPTPRGDVAAGAAEVVSVSGRSYLVTDTGRPSTSTTPLESAALPLPGRVAGPLLTELGLSAVPVPVDPSWLSLFPRGVALRRSAYDVGAAGPVGYAAQLGAGVFRAGQLVTRSDITYLLTQRGVAPLDDFARDVYVALFQPGPAREVTSLPAVLRTDAFPDRWPTSEVTPVAGRPCARLVTGPGMPPTVRVAGDATSSADVQVAAGTVNATVEAGHGALVRSGTFDSASGPGSFLIDADATTYAITDPSGLTTAHLGYAGVDQPVVPDTWLKLLRSGSPLSADRAGRSPESSP